MHIELLQSTVINRHLVIYGFKSSVVKIHSLLYTNPSAGYFTFWKGCLTMISHKTLYKGKIFFAMNTQTDDKDGVYVCNIFLSKQVRKKRFRVFTLRYERQLGRSGNFIFLFKLTLLLFLLFSIECFEVANISLH